MNQCKFITVSGDADNWEQAIRICGKALVDAGYVDQSFVEGCVEREAQYPTGLPAKIPVAIPHSQSDSITENAICVCKLSRPVVFYRLDSSDEYIETKLVFNLAIKSAEDHMDFLQNLMGLVMDEEKLEKCTELPLEDIPAYLGTFL